MGHPCNLFWFIFVFSSNKRKRGPLKTPIFVDLSSTHQTIRLLSCTNCEYLAKIHTHLVKRYSIYAHRQTDTQTDRQTDTQTDRHTDRQTHRQTYRQTHILHPYRRVQHFLRMEIYTFSLLYVHSLNGRIRPKTDDY